MIGRIHIKNLVFHGHHGVLPEETRLGQRFELDLELVLDIAAAAAADDLSQTVNYADVAALCARIVQGERHRLLETLARRLLMEILQHHPTLLEAGLVLRKPSAPVPAIFDTIALETRLTRAEFQRLSLARQ
ncbi:dihydroneopterin aldolase [Opitutaceae bacterium TAV4]|uniref:dihydroneopterin aldolase n=1 Tax=Geminisphaera colitermitum TaxID=1148786 RepID=UPI000158C4A3|nr:dihydroneopterin aldolase [Geminisphaera colitermitum]RRJ94549.1 dihydroneopterin aldolase [Opitutaceae bacterium TAV4]RRJ98609.1 dihydroneopterin aldolase [Opitutaceae bacterium TAV3]